MSILRLRLLATVLGVSLCAACSSTSADDGGKSPEASATSAEPDPKGTAIGGSSATVSTAAVPAPSSGPVSKGGAPDFTLPTLAGSNMSLSEHQGKVVLIDFWSTTCQPCLAEMPHLVALYDKYKDKGLIVLGVAADGPETMSKVSATVRSKKMTFPVLLDEETSVIARYNPKKDMPFWVLVDKKGNIVSKKNGYSPGDEKVLAAEIEKLLQ